MKKSFYLLIVSIGFLFLGTSCTTSHFGVPDRAAGVPAQFDQTEAAIAQAERSQGAKYCPEKIAKAKELARKGVRDLLGLPHGGGYGTLSGSSPGGQRGRRMPTATTASRS